VVAPQKISDTLGAEILRLWVASTDYSGELSIDDKILAARGRGLSPPAQHPALPAGQHRRLRCRRRTCCRRAEWLEIDRYALALTRKLQEQCTPPTTSASSSTRSCRRCMNFCSEDLGAFYLDILKDRLYTTARIRARRRSAQSALWHILQTVTRLMAPVLSFTAEESGRR
jgi:isoleucyl-tRNA synthetase